MHVFIYIGLLVTLSVKTSFFFPSPSSCKYCENDEAKIRHSFKESHITIWGKELRSHYFSRLEKEKGKNASSTKDWWENEDFSLKVPAPVALRSQIIVLPPYGNKLVQQQLITGGDDVQ